MAVQQPDTVSERDDTVSETDDEYECGVCGIQFATAAQLEVHEQITPRCVSTAGKCYFYEQCGFETEDIAELCRHLKRDADLHLHALSINVNDIKEQVKPTDASMDTQMEITGNYFEMHAEAAKKRLDNAPVEDTLISEAAQVLRDNSIRIRNIDQAINEITKLTLCGKIESLPSLNAICREVNNSGERIERILTSFQRYEKITQGRPFLWVIDNYKMNRQAEIDGSIQCQVSNPFSATQHGYKLEALAYLNGFGDARGTHLSIFVRLVKGDFDDILEFPFNNKVNFMLHHKPYDGDIVSKVCEPNPTKRYTQRYPNNFRMSFGINKFAYIDDVESTSYLMNDKIYIDIEVNNDGSDMSLAETADENVSHCGEPCM